MNTVKEQLQTIRNDLYQVNSINVSLYMLGMKQRDDKTVMDTNECLGEILKQLDNILKELP